MNGVREQLRGVLLSVLIVTSVFAGSITFAGTAGASHGADFQITGLSSPGSATTAETVNVDVTINNTANVSGTQNVTLDFNGSVQDSQTVTLGAGNNTTVTLAFDASNFSPGNAESGDLVAERDYNFSDGDVHDGINVTTENDTRTQNFTVVTSASLSVFNQSTDGRELVVDSYDLGAFGTNVTVWKLNQSTRTPIEPLGFATPSSGSGNNLTISLDPAIETTQFVGVAVHDGDATLSTNFLVKNGTAADTALELTETDSAPTPANATTADADDDGDVDEIAVEFNESVDDTSVDAGDFNLSMGSVAGVWTGATANDTTVTLNVTGINGTAATPDVTVLMDSINDTTGDPGPASGTVVSASDGARPVVTSSVVDPTQINESATPATVDVNLTFSENLTTTPTVQILDLNQSPLSVTGTLSMGGSAFNGTSDTINDQNEDNLDTVNVTGGADGAGNSVESTNETGLLTVDTEAPSVEQNFTNGTVVSGTVDLVALFNISDSDGVGNDTFEYRAGTGGNFTAVNESNETAFDTTTVSDTLQFHLRATEVDDIGNAGSDTGRLEVDNTPPNVTITSPTPPEVKSSDPASTLTVGFDIDEAHLTTVNITLASGNDTVEYNNVPASAGSNTVTLDIVNNTTTTGTNIDNVTGDGFVSGQIYNLTVTATDVPGAQGADRQADTLVVDNDEPIGLIIKKPTLPIKEYNDDDGTPSETNDLQIGYIYTENNTDRVEVRLTRNGVTETSTIVNDSQYLDDGYQKSFELEFGDSLSRFISEGRYNVSIVVTDQAGNSQNESTATGPVLYNRFEERPSVFIPFGGISAPSEPTGFDGTVNVTYDTTVRDEDSENISLTTFEVEVEGYRYNNTTQNYNFFRRFVTVQNTTNRSSGTYTERINLSRIESALPANTKEAWTGDFDVRVTDDGVYSTIGGQQTGFDSEFEFIRLKRNYTRPRITSVETDAGTDTALVRFNRPVSNHDDSEIDATDFAYQSANNSTGATIITSASWINDTAVWVTFDNDVAPDDLGNDLVSAAEGSFENPRSNLEVSAKRAVELNDTTAPSAPASVSVPDLTAENEDSYPVTVDLDSSEMVSLNVSIIDGIFIDNVTVEDPPDSGDQTATVELNATALDARNFTVDVIVTDFAPTPHTVAVNRTVTVDDPTVESAVVRENASKVNVTFDEPIAAADGNLSADEFNYTDANGIGAGAVVAADRTADDTVVVTLDAAAQGDDLGVDEVGVVADAVIDRAGVPGAASSAPLLEKTSPSNLTVVRPAGRTVVQSFDDLAVAYAYVENVPDNTESVTIKLFNDEGTTYTYNINDSQYVDDGVVKAIKLDLNEPDMRTDDRFPTAPLVDEQYNVSIVATDGEGNTHKVTTEERVVINDRGPEISRIDATPENDVAPGEDVNVSFSLIDAANVTDMKISLVRNGRTVNTTRFDVSIPEPDKRTFNESGNLSADIVFLIDDSGSMSDEISTVKNELQTFADEISGQGEVRFAVMTFADELRVLQQPTSDVSKTQATIGNISAGGGFEMNYDAINGTINGSHINTSQDRRTVIIDLTDEDADTTSTSPTQSELATAMNDQEVKYIAVSPDRTGPLEKKSLADLTDGAAWFDIQQFDSEVLLTEIAPEVRQITRRTTVTKTITVPATITDNRDYDVRVMATDESGHANSATAHKELDVNAEKPHLEHVETDANDSTATVRFNEPVVPMPGDFRIDKTDFAYQDVNGEGARMIDRVIRLNASTFKVMFDARVTRSGLGADLVSVRENEIRDTDGANARIVSASHTVALADTTRPEVVGMAVERGTTNVTLAFDEPVEAGDGGTLSADNFSYVDADGTGATGIAGVTQTGSDTVVLTLNTSVNQSDIRNDAINISAGEVFDLGGNDAAAQSLPLAAGVATDLRASSTGTTVTVTVETPNTISTALGGNLTIIQRHTVFESPEGGEHEPRFVATLTAGDFTETSPGVFEANVSVADDGAYDVTGEIDGLQRGAATVVDTAVPEPTDAVIAGVGGSDRKTTFIGVVFSEPINASGVGPADVSIEGFDGSIERVIDAGESGAILIAVDGYVQTGTSPSVSIDGASYTDLNGTAGVDSSTTLHTDILDLNEGANFVSVPAASGGLPISALNTSKIDAVFKYNATADSFEAFDPAAKENDFTRLKGGVGYIVMMKENASFAVNVDNVPTGRSPPNTVALDEGYNLVGHFQEDQQGVERALSSVAASGEFTDTVFRVLRQAEGSAGFEYESYRAGAFSRLERGEAYYVFVTDDEVYTEAPFGQPVASS